MGLPRFFPENKIHRFEYRPMFYNEEKEEFERRRAQIRRELGTADEDDARILQSGTFKRMYERKHEEMRDSNRRIMILAIALGLIVYFTNRYFNFF